MFRENDLQQPSYREYIARMQERVHAAIAPLIGAQPLAIVDFPDIRNVGDSAIWLGEIAYLKRQFGKAPSYVSTLGNFNASELERCMPEGPVFIHGGGNFGDIWAAHQNFREQVIQRFPNRLVVQFPQSIHYDDPARAEVTARVIGQHKNFVLLVRDEESKHFAEKHFDCVVKLCPDMAFCIGAVQAPAPTLPVLAMLREDREKVGSRAGLEGLDLPVEDWISEPKLPIARAKLLGTLAGLPDRMQMRRRRFDAAAEQRFERGIRQIGRARALVTDRLHVHIVSLLLGRPHAVLDNSYGKINRFMQAFPGGMDLTYRASSLADAVAWAKAQAGAEPARLGAPVEQTP